MRQLERLEAGLMTGNGLDPPLQGISRCRHSGLEHSQTQAALQMCITKHAHMHIETGTYLSTQSCVQSWSHTHKCTHACTHTQIYTQLPTHHIYIDRHTHDLIHVQT